MFGNGGACDLPAIVGQNGHDVAVETTATPQQAYRSQRCPMVPAFRLAGSAVGPLRAKSEPAGSRDFMNLWSGQAARLARRGVPAGELTRALASEALARL
jgi:NAD(P)H-dependent flavin oxidoreductase YrpB (nitropropane dioxygenase family)